MGWWQVADKSKNKTCRNAEKWREISGDSEFDMEYCVTLGFSYLDNMLKWDEDGETRGSYREIRVFDTEQEEVILEF